MSQFKFSGKRSARVSALSLSSYGLLGIQDEDILVDNKGDILLKDERRALVLAFNAASIRVLDWTSFKIDYDYRNEYEFNLIPTLTELNAKPFIEFKKELFLSGLIFNEDNDIYRFKNTLRLFLETYEKLCKKVYISATKLTEVLSTESGLNPKLYRQYRTFAGAISRYIEFKTGYNVLKEAEYKGEVNPVTFYYDVSGLDYVNGAVERFYQDLTRYSDALSLFLEVVAPKFKDNRKLVKGYLENKSDLFKYVFNQLNLVGV